MDEAKKAKIRREIRRRTELAAKGLYECQGKCKQTYPLHEGLVITWGGAVLLSVCPRCFVDKPVVLRKTERGVEASYLPEEAPYGRLVDVFSPDDVPELAIKAALPTFKKETFE